MARNPNKVGVWQSLRNAWKVQDIRKKLVYTFLMLVVFRLVGVIPAPGVDYARVQASMGSNTLPLLDLVNMMTGSNFQNMTIMAMGITPYINSSIIMQLLTIAIPALERLQKSGPEGQKKIAQITRYVTVGLAVVQAIGLVASLGYIKSGWFNTVLVGVSMAGGTALAMWIGERITEKGLGNGISLLIFAGIISNLFTGFTTLIRNAFQATSLTPWADAPGGAAGGAGDDRAGHVRGYGRAPHQCPLRQARQRPQDVRRPEQRDPHEGGQRRRAAADLRLFLHGVPRHHYPAGGAGSDSAAAIWWSRYMNGASFWYLLVTALLIIAFTYFYSSISFQPDEMAKNIQQQGGAVPSVRPGKPTADYLRRINGRLTLFAALFLAILATVPTVFTVGLQTQIPFAASSILIAVSVVLETKRQLDDLLVSRNYDSIS